MICSSVNRAFICPSFCWADSTQIWRSFRGTGQSGDIDGTLESSGARWSRSELLDELISEIQAGNGHALAVKLDVSSQEDVGAFVKKTVLEFGRLDALVNNAGSLADSANFLSTTPDQWVMRLRVNMLGPMMPSKAVIPEMRKVGGGRIVNIGSTGSLGAEPGFGAYTAMKHGLVGLSKTLAAGFGADGILCNTVCPGYFATDTDRVDTGRLLAMAKLSGVMLYGDTTLIPNVQLTYTSDDQKAYRDSLGNLIPSQGIAWGRVELGLIYRFTERGLFQVETFCDGIGKSNYESYGLQVGLDLEF
ncbi:SDR family oxidoreductase [Pseudophaeobacter sp.]|uniref:SDR family NAD(P)-dependent oxidoreductase n=1 Tax=Pseudophaeobacter sp. TaxID=1971739 RepID=UPI0032977EC8